MACFSREPEYYMREAEIDRAEAMLCAILTSLTGLGLIGVAVDAVDEVESGVSKDEIRGWFKEHQEADELRKVKELEKATEKKKRKALSKLTQEEIELLGLWHLNG